MTKEGEAQWARLRELVKQTNEDFDYVRNMAFKIAEKEGIPPSKAAEMIWKLAEAGEKGREAGRKLREQLQPLADKYDRS